MPEYYFDEGSFVEEIKDLYADLRLDGKTRDQAINEIYEEYADVLQNDIEEGSVIRIAIALALSRKNELTLEAREEAVNAIEILRKRSFEEEDPWIPSGYFDKFLKKLSEKHLGSEAVYRKKRTYDPGWEIGDTFIHPFTIRKAMEMGLTKWYIVIRKIGEYLDKENHHNQLVYITICPPDAIPATKEELDSLGYLRMMKHDKGWDYIGQLSFSSRKDEERWQLTKIGCFPDAGRPADAMEENPYVTMPFFGVLHKNSSEFSYEKAICLYIKQNGIGKNEA